MTRSLYGFSLPYDTSLSSKPLSRGAWLQIAASEKDYLLVETPSAVVPISLVLPRRKSYRKPYQNLLFHLRIEIILVHS